MGKDAHARVFQGGGQVVEAAAEEVVVDDDFGNVGFKQFIDDVAADQPRPAYDQKPLAGDVHARPPSLSPCFLGIPVAPEDQRVKIIL